MPSSARGSNARRSAASWSGTEDPCSPIRSMWPDARASPESGSTSWNFRDDEPELITSTRRSPVMRILRLDRGDDHRVHDVLDQRAAGQVVDRLSQPLPHPGDRGGPRAAL